PSSSEEVLNPAVFLRNGQDRSLRWFGGLKKRADDIRPYGNPDDTRRNKSLPLIGRLFCFSGFPYFSLYNIES
ncbi:MAG: hypothetical protein IJE28_04855, partial [Oscillospiraceae bacterium]|nr:hypothetical protein [Oscillospiraceae bacterium]